MKEIIKILSLTSFVLMGFINKMSSQSIPIDTALLNKIQLKADSIERIYVEWESLRHEYYDIRDGFCYLNIHDKKRGELVLNAILNGYLFETHEKNQFLSWKITCFDSEQKEKIKRSLSKGLNPNDKHYHELVSSYQLFSQISYLESHFSDSIFFHIGNKIYEEDLDKWDIIQLRNMATLINLGYHPISDYINEINNLYSIFKKQEKLNIFYGDILRNSIALLNSKMAVIETLYMLDESQKSITESYDDVADLGFAFSYFTTCIQPKLKNLEIENLAWTNLQENKEKIKEIILTDNSIWLDHIKIENK